MVRASCIRQGCLHLDDRAPASGDLSVEVDEFDGEHRFTNATLAR